MQLRLGKNVSRHARGINTVACPYMQVRLGQYVFQHTGTSWTIRAGAGMDSTCPHMKVRVWRVYTYPYMQVRLEQYLSLRTGAAWTVLVPTCRCGLDSVSYIQVRVHTYRYILNHTCRCSMDNTCHHMKVRAMAWTVCVPIRRYAESQVGSGDNVSGLSISNLINSLYINVLLSKREYITG